MLKIQNSLTLHRLCHYITMCRSDPKTACFIPRLFDTLSLLVRGVQLHFLSIINVFVCVSLRTRCLATFVSLFTIVGAG